MRALGGLHLDELADHTVVNEVEDLLPVDVFEHVRAADADRAALRESGIHRRLDQRQRQIAFHLVAAVRQHAHPQHHLLQRLAVFRRDKLHLRLSLAGEQRVGRDTEQLCQRRQQRDVGEGVVGFT